MNTSNPLHGERRAGTVGPALPDVEVRVVGGDGASLPAGEAGDLQVRGPNVFRGYWRMPQKTLEDFTSDGFFNTGDKASISPDGYVSIVGRARDMIICGGLNVYPKEIELLLDGIAGRWGSRGHRRAPSRLRRGSSRGDRPGRQVRAGRASDH